MQSSSLSKALATFQLGTNIVSEMGAIMMKTSYFLSFLNDSKVRRTKRALKSSLTCETNTNSTIYLYDLPERKSYLVS